MAWPSCPCSSRVSGLIAGSYYNPWGRKEVLKGSTADHLNGGKRALGLKKKEKKKTQENTHTKTPQSTYKHNKTPAAAWTVPSISMRLTDPSEAWPPEGNAERSVRAGWATSCLLWLWGARDSDRATQDTSAQQEGARQTLSSTHRYYSRSVGPS